MTQAFLQNLLQQGEGLQVEFKESFFGRDMSVTFGSTKPKQTMDTNQTYDFIGQMADGLSKHKIQIKFSALRKILEDKGREIGEGKGMASCVRGAYNYWMKKDETVADSIANTYTNKYGTCLGCRASG